MEGVKCSCTLGSALQTELWGTGLRVFEDFCKPEESLFVFLSQFFFFFFFNYNGRMGLDWVWRDLQDHLLQQELPRNNFCFPSIWKEGNQAETLALWTCCSWSCFLPPAAHQHEFKVWFLLMDFVVPVPLALPLGCSAIKIDPFLLSLFSDLICIHVNFQCLSNSWQWVYTIYQGAG